jgi:hypothetical protein
VTNARLLRSVDCGRRSAKGLLTAGSIGTGRAPGLRLVHSAGSDRRGFRASSEEPGRSAPGVSVLPSGETSGVARWSSEGGPVGNRAMTPRYFGPDGFGARRLGDDMHPAIRAAVLSYQAARRYVQRMRREVKSWQ